MKVKLINFELLKINYKINFLKTNVLLIHPCQHYIYFSILDFLQPLTKLLRLMTTNFVRMSELEVNLKMPRSEPTKKGTSYA